MYKPLKDSMRKDIAKVILISGENSVSPNGFWVALRTRSALILVTHYVTAKPLVQSKLDEERNMH
jgi:hypothetical protein